MKGCITKPARHGARLMRSAIAAFLVIAAPGAVLAVAGKIHEVVQKNRMFQVKELTIIHGELVRFINADEFLHQIYVKSPDFSFDSDEQVPGKAIDVKFPAGVFEVRCRIHPKMLLVVHAE